jgi:hypothetical protein
MEESYGTHSPKLHLTLNIPSLKWSLSGSSSIKIYVMLVAPMLRTVRPKQVFTTRLQTKQTDR